MASSALPETLRSITAIKIQELTQQRNKFEASRSNIQSKAASEKNELASTKILLDGIRQMKNVRVLNDESGDEDDIVDGADHRVPLHNAGGDLRNKNRLLNQLRTDPSVDTILVKQIRSQLERELELESIRHQHAQFFSELVTEWLSNPDDEAQPSESTTFEEVGRKEMHEQRATWEGLVFKEAVVDVADIEAYLKKLFTSTKAVSLGHEKIVKKTKQFGKELWDQKDLFSADSLKRTMRGLIQTNLLSDEKNATLRAFTSNKEVLKEVADVLNMRYVTLGTWKWTIGKNGIPVEMRRQLNGKYRVFMDEDVLDAILLYEIGLQWSVHFQSTFRTFFQSFAWKRTAKVIPKTDLARRDYYLENDKNTGDDTLHFFRHMNYANNYFLTQLPTHELQGKRNYEDDDDDSDDGRDTSSMSPLELKHRLLHMLVAESLIAKDINPESVHTVIRSDFKWFGPALPHGTIYTVLKFFGVDEAWLKFFSTFLESPVSFIQDGPKAQTQTRKRGIPMSHTLSDMFGETVLFVMDFAVNQATSSYLYRLHDDFWLWGSEDTCLKGWQAMTKYAAVMGFEFNEEKTGTVRFGADTPSTETSDSDSSEDDASVVSKSFQPSTAVLPKGEVRWGFLRLDAPSGRFVVDQAQVDEHITELKLQLSYCNSIFSYVQSYNAYVGRFFTNNFGKPSFGFGREHVDMMIDTFVRIQKALYPSGSVTDHLSHLASTRFGIGDLPQGFWYFPVTQGGLELRNPLIPLLGMRESFRRTPKQMLAKCRDKDEADYIRAEQRFKEHGSVGFNRGINKGNTAVIEEIRKSGETFMPIDEYMQYREERSRHLAELAAKFIKVPPETKMETTADLEGLLAQGNPKLPGKLPDKRGSPVGPGLCSSFVDMQPYWKWVVALYGKDVVEKYGSVRLVDGGQVPLGVVSLMKKGRVKWRG